MVKPSSAGEQATQNDQDSPIQPVQVSILITNWNTRDFLEKCLRSLEEVLFLIPPLDPRGSSPANPQSLSRSDPLPAWETIVVDNASSDGSAEMVREKFPWVQLIENQQNLGFGGGCNLAARLAHGEYLLVLNPDVILFPLTIFGLLTFLQQTPRAGAVGPRILNPDGSLQVSIFPRPSLFREAWRLFHLDHLIPLSQYPASTLKASQPQEVDVLMGACILLRSEIVSQVGLFDERFFMYSEEVDLCQRIQQAGWQIFWLPSVEIVHFGGQSTRLVADQMFIELYRNKLNYFRKHPGSNRPFASAVAVGVYKSILLAAALSRWLTGEALSRLPNISRSPAKREHWATLARQYQHLLQELPHL